MRQIDGMDILDKEISGMVRQLNGAALERAVSAAGDEILKEVEIRSPVKTGKLKASIRKLIFPKENRASSIIQVANSKRGGIQHYAVFLEFGTSKMPPKPFMRPAFDVSQLKAVEAFSKALSTELEK